MVDRVLQGLSFLLLIGLAAFMIFYVQGQREALECQERQNAAFRVALGARSTSSSEDRAAQRQLLVELFGRDDVTAEDRRASLDRYLRASDALAAQRPALPTEDVRCA
ncbi:hypothetical protein [Pseudonocardia alni]|uniref:hypothetical protein n=1 Tax=Pseudonocardia alni TaxID=33907 RepID=UPI003330F7B3